MITQNNNSINFEHEYQKGLRKFNQKGDVFQEWKKEAHRSFNQEISLKKANDTLKDPKHNDRI